VEVEWGRVRAQAARGEEWGRSGSGDGDDSVLVKHGGRTHGGPARGDKRWHVGHRSTGLGRPNMNSVAFYLFKELFKRI
jgi:hypothetical protein